MLATTLLFACLSSPTAEPVAAPFTVTAMAPLVVGSLEDPHDPRFEHEWRRFADDLAVLRDGGVDAISLDVWWGNVEPADQEFDWRWVDRMAETIVAAGMKWRPVLAFHSCGDNVGDSVRVPLPSWIWDRYTGVAGIEGPSDLRYQSALGHESEEAVAVWATPVVVEQYRELFDAFRDHFAPYAASTSALAIGLGPASELRYPSYNAHDPGAGFPSRGVLQAYSRRAVESFRAFAIARHGDVDGVQRAWGFPLVARASIYPPTQLDGFFAREEHAGTAYGRDFFDWYASSLLEHLDLVIGAAADAFAGSAFEGVPLDVRIPGVHWRMDTRLAELAAGLVTTNAPAWDVHGAGYRPLFEALAALRARANVHAEFTSIEMGNGEGGPAASSRAEDLAFWIGSEAARAGVPLGGENALASNLQSPQAWDHIENVLRWSAYESLTLLRTSDVARSPYALGRLRALRRAANSRWTR